VSLDLLPDFPAPCSAATAAAPGIQAQSDRADQFVLC